MRTNIILMMAFLIFLVGFFSSQTLLTGQASKIVNTPWSNADVAEFTDVTSDTCRTLDLYLYGRHKNLDSSLSNVEDTYLYDSQESYTSDVARYAYTLPVESYDFDNNGRLTESDSWVCYRIVRKAGFSTDIREDLSTSPWECTAEQAGKTRCIGGNVHVCSQGPLGEYSYALQQTRGPGERCKQTRLSDGSIIAELTHRVIINNPLRYGTTP